MAQLSEEIKCFIVQNLACYDVPSHVVQMVQDEYGVTLTRAHVQYYDPTRSHGSKELSEKYKKLFAETRKKFLEEAMKIPVANQSYRLRILQRMLDHHIQRKNYVLAQSVIEQAAKESGGFYTNKIKMDTPLSDLLKSIEDFAGGSVPIVYDAEFKQMPEREVETVAQIEHTKEKKSANPPKIKWSEPKSKTG